MPALVAGIHVLARGQGVDGRVISAFTPVLDGLCPAMTNQSRIFTAALNLSGADVQLTAPRNFLQRQG
jgi:hypothetical protein